MPLSAIEPSQVRRQSALNSKSTPGIGFGEALGALAAPAATAAAVTMGPKGYQTSAIINAATTGIVGGQQALASNAPYMTTAGSPFASGGYNYGGVPSAGGYVGGSAGAGIPGVGGVSAGVGGAGMPSQDYQEKQALFQQMNDANWEMLVAQVTVSEISRDYQARSNILKTKSDTELNAVRNMRA